MKLTVVEALPSLCQIKDSCRPPLRIALVQFHWDANSELHEARLEDGIEKASGAGAKIIFLPELTLSRYPADKRPTTTPNLLAEQLNDGPTRAFAARMAAKYNVFIHASLYEYQDFEDGRGLNTAIIVSPLDGNNIVARTPKLHIPVTAGYYENKYFQPGPAGHQEGSSTPYPVYNLEGARIGIPTCWDEWFPEVARCYSLAGAEILTYATAIGSEPDHPNFDTEPLWRQVIIGNGIANGLFMVVPNRWGNEGSINFYGSSFVSDPFGRVLARASRDQDEVLVVDIVLEHRRDWLDLFPFLATRRPDSYTSLVRGVVNGRRDDDNDSSSGGVCVRPEEGVLGGIAGVSAL